MRHYYQDVTKGTKFIGESLRNLKQVEEIKAQTKSAKYIENIVRVCCISLLCLTYTNKKNVGVLGFVGFDLSIAYLSVCLSGCNL